MASGRLRLELSGGGRLRPLKDTDSEALHAVIVANRAQLARWLPWADGQTLEDTLGFIRRGRQQMADNDGFHLAVECDGGIAGVIGYHSVNWAHRSTSLGYWLAEERQCRGTMTEATRLLTDHALSAWELNRVEIRAAAGNVRSRAIPERLGFRQEGILREAEWVRGRPLDSVVYSQLAAEWRRPAAT